MQYIKENQQLINKLLDRRFTVTLEELATGNYDDATIKEQTLNILNNISLQHLRQYDQTRQSLPRLIKSIESDLPNLYSYDIMQVLWFAINTNNHKLTAITLGAINRFASTNQNLFNALDFETIIKNYIKLFSKKKPSPADLDILKLFIATATRILGSNFKIETIIQYAKMKNITPIVEYLTSLSSQNTK